MKSSREYTEDEEKDLAEHAKDEPPSEEEMDEMARHYASMEKSARTPVMDMIFAARRRR